MIFTVILLCATTEPCLKWFITKVFLCSWHKRDLIYTLGTELLLFFSFFMEKLIHKRFLTHFTVLIRLIKFDKVLEKTGITQESFFVNVFELFYFFPLFVVKRQKILSYFFNRSQLSNQSWDVVKISKSISELSAIYKYRQNGLTDIAQTKLPVLES